MAEAPSVARGLLLFQKSGLFGGSKAQLASHGLRNQTKQVKTTDPSRFGTQRSSVEKNHALGGYEGGGAARSPKRERSARLAKKC